MIHFVQSQADENQLSSVDLEPLPFLQIVSLANNRITSTKGLNHPLLEKLNLLSEWNMKNFLAGLERAESLCGG